MIVVFVIVLVVFGPHKLPELARGLGKLMAEFRKASTDFKSAFEEEMRDLERQAREVERRKAEAASAAAAAQTQPATLATPSGARVKVLWSLLWRKGTSLAKRRRVPQTRRTRKVAGKVRRLPHRRSCRRSCKKRTTENES
jgi:sec-independent protein translocase protein TatB